MVEDKNEWPVRLDSAELPSVFVSDETGLKMERELVSLDDVRRIIRDTESEGRKLYDVESGHSIAHGGVGAYTCWVIYEPSGDGYRVIDVYTHRMQALEET